MSSWRFAFFLCWKCWWHESYLQVEMKPRDALPAQHVALKRHHTLPIEDRYQSANSPLHPGTTSLTYGHNGAGESEEKIKAPYVSCLNVKSDHTFTAQNWKAEREKWLWWACLGLTLALPHGLVSLIPGTDLAERKEQEWRGQCHFKRWSSYRAFGFLLCLLDFLYSENGPSERRKVSAVVKRPHSIEGLIART